MQGDQCGKTAQQEDPVGRLRPAAPLPDGVPPAEIRRRDDPGHDQQHQRFDAEHRAEAIANEHQKLFLVSTRNCTPLIDESPSSGNATSTCSTFPSAERLLPKRRPKPTSLSRPCDAAPNGSRPQVLPMS